MNYATRTTVTALTAAAALLVAACGKNDDAQAPSAAAEAPADPAPAKEPAPSEPPATDPDATGDYVTVMTAHSDPKKGPVEVKFHNFQITEAQFDPANLEGGTATLEIDLASLTTGSDKRDKHLRSPDYLGVEQYPKAIIKIAGVKKQGDRRYQADADVDVHGVKVKWPLEFQVVAETPEAIVVEGNRDFKRSEINVGGGDDDSVAQDMQVRVRLTLKKPS